MADDKCKQSLRTYLFGYPIHHSLAPVLHNAIYQGLGVPWTYELIESSDKADFLLKLQAEDCIGSAVTMPHKVAWLKECDEVTDEGRAIGAINTVYIRRDLVSGKRRYIGTNTDCIGVREAFLQNFPGILNESQGQPALVLGGGGACRSAIYALHKWLGASEIYLVNRLPEEVDAIMQSFAATDSPPKLLHVSSVEQAAALEAPVIVVGTVPDFPPVTPGEIEARNIVIDFLKRDRKGYVLEMCYHPKIVTKFYTLAVNYGWKVLPGTEPMIYQGLAQQVLWMERPLSDMPRAVAKAVVDKELARRQAE